MTEIGEKWAISKDVPKKDAEDFEIRHIIEDADFWVRAFCDSLEAKAREFSEPDDDNDAENICIGIAYSDIKRELLGDHDAK